LSQRDQILVQVQEIVRNVLDDDLIELTFATVAADIPLWDSIAHVRIMVEVERVFNFRFEIEELNSFNSVGALVDGICAKLTVAGPHDPRQERE
jgi:acyl carrier protein